MAGSRRYKIGDIFTRTSGLLQTNALKAEDKPVWYDVYEAFPPLEPPRYERPKSYLTIKPIFYPEDLIRAKYYRKYGSRDTLNLNEAFHSKRMGFCQAFVEAYQKLEEEAPHADEDELMFKAERQLESQGIYLDLSRKPAQQASADAEETPPVPVGELEVPDSLLKGFHLSNLFSAPSNDPLAAAEDLHDEELTPEEQELVRKSAEEMNKVGPIVDDKITRELFSLDDDEDEYEGAKSPKVEIKKGDPCGEKQS